MSEPVGFIGLGNMGGALARTLLARRVELVVHDAAGPDRTPPGARWAARAGEVAARSEVIVLSLPDGAASQEVAEELVAEHDGRVRTVVDTSTIGIGVAEEVARHLGQRGIGYVDAPVSGGPAGAATRSLALMYAGSDEACAVAEPVLAALSDRRHRVGTAPGRAQALKLANNFLSATALAATSEAIAFGLRAGLELTTMLDVLNASSGRNSATADKFPNHVVTGRYASGFSNSLMEKDLRLYLGAVGEQAGRSTVGHAVAATWERFAAEEPGADFTRIFPFLA